MSGPLLHALIDGGPRVAMQAGRAALAAEVDVDGEEDLVGALDGLPHGDERLPGGLEVGVGLSDAAGVVLDGRAVDDGVFVVAASGVGLVQLDGVRAVQVRAANVAARLAAVLAVDGGHLDEVVPDARGLFDALRQGRQGEVGRGDAVVDGARVVLDLLEEDEVRGAQLGDDLGYDAGQVRRVGG